MEAGRRIFWLLAILLAAALPPLAAFAAVLASGQDWVGDLGYGTALLIAGALTVGWATIVAVIADRILSAEALSMVRLAQRGGASRSTEEEALTVAQRRLAEALEERNRQIAELAAHVRAAPVSEDAAAVVRSIVRAARSMTGDPTWTLAVTSATRDSQLVPGVYTTENDVQELEDVHGWASTVEADDQGRQARHATGPWGAFVIVDVAVGDDLRGVLLAPREGRQPPSPAELDLFALLGQHASTSVDHAVLYGRLRAQSEELNRMSALQADFLRGVTHDLQTPLTSIGAVAAELLHAPGLDERARADLETITYQADRLRRMVGQLLAVSRLEAGALTPRLEVLRAEPIVRRTWAALRADRPFVVTSVGPGHLLVADPDRLEQVLWAVLDNAVKYSPEGTPVSARISSVDDHGAFHGVIEIADEGAGMDAQTLRHAFEQFYRSADARRLSPDGSGIGLHAARGLVEAMGGAIRAVSRLGAGTTVTITLPAELAETAEDPEAPPAG